MQKEIIKEKKTTLALTQYLEWLKELIKERVENKSNQPFEEMLLLHPEPVIQKKDTETILILFEKHNLSLEEKVIFLLSISPYYISGYLNKISQEIKNGQAVNLILSSKSNINNSYIPTIETALIIIAGNSISKRHHLMNLFTKHSNLQQNQLIDIAKSTPYDPFTTLRLLPGEKAFQYLVTGETSTPTFSSNFPAILLETDYEWDDLILPPDTMQQIKEIKEWVEFDKLIKLNGHKKTKFKPGCKCLFYGSPGTGKTLAATLLGKYTHKKVYKIDLSAVVSKYIGETEKNLSTVFDQAAHGNWILFFDEADALFGKRGATKSSNDRYANQEVSYLLQRFEAYEGLSILASNFKDNIDAAFFRRFHNIVKFINPSVDERAKLWESYLPEGYEYEKQININEVASGVSINGAAIYNIVRRAYMKAVLRNDNIILGKDLVDSLKMEKFKEGKIV